MLQLLVSESGSEKMCLQSPAKTFRLFAARTSTSSLFHMFGTATAESATAICSSSRWHLEQRSL